MNAVAAYIPAFSTLAIGVLALIALAQLAPRLRRNDDDGLLLQLLGWGLALVLVVVFVVALPVSDSVRGQILSLIGVVLTAIIALSSTTFVANAMAGIMLQMTKPFKPGDFIQANGVFGRVTHRALVHTRVQTDTRDFTTLPNLMLVTHPVTVLHREGTIIQIDVSLGYDVNYRTAETHLKTAAADASLQDPYVLVTELLDHAVVYRIAGFMADLKNPINARSVLRKCVLDALHHADIEITSPSVVAQRQQPGDTRTLPSRVAVPMGEAADSDDVPDSMIFDSAEEAAAMERLRDDLLATRSAIDAQQKKLKQLSAAEKPAEEATLARLKQKLDWLEAQVKRAGDNDDG